MELEAWLPTLENNPQALAGVVKYFGGFEAAGDVWRTADLDFLEAAASGNLTAEEKQGLVSKVFDEARNGQRSIPRPCVWQMPSTVAGSPVMPLSRC